ncbi:MAG: hypothetical protein PV358_03985 [Acidimicrobiales bacterium]|nr:hypothetical protein [Acidimicrobiales bacterium]
MPARTPLSRERVLRAALALVDEEGVEALTMRRLGRDLGVEMPVLPDEDPALPEPGAAPRADGARAPRLSRRAGGAAP